ncbi:hypothetical protein [Novosphingobium aerophilum]|uniref:hypothetical protein n=2 Tax=Novosphingobium aerophilum TaxID=2839843 RepID=UPI003FD1EAD7
MVLQKHRLPQVKAVSSDKPYPRVGALRMGATHDPGEQIRGGVMGSQSTTMKLCTYMGAIAGTMMFLGIWPVAHLFPPLAPSMPHAQVAQYYREHQVGILVGGILITSASVLFFPFLGALATFMKKIEGPVSPLTWSFVMIVAYGFVTLFFAGLFFTVAAYRLDRPDTEIVLLSDIAFFLFVMPAVPAFVQNIVTGIVILQDRKTAPTLPRWLGYLNLWTGVLFLPGLAVGLFKSGPFAWNGVLAFWLPAVVFGIWFNVMIFAMLAAIKRGALAGE